ncbi:MAG: glycogen/starch synthase [Paludibacteraceae bacterium]|nr:glycogen/starch synthase [Paludibacteraceae bacterium]MBP6285106.1 glycogen/starch synthase [Paludibacteraceae bacterium]
MDNVIKVLYVTQEICPYLPESEIADISRKLPQAIQEKGKEIRTFMPKYGCINERRNQLHEVIRLSGMNLIIDDTDHQLIIKVASIQSARMQVYFIDNDDYFNRKNTTQDDDGVDFDDNEDRAIFFARGVIETVKKLRWTPDIVHCHGWMTSLMPIYVKKAFNDDPFFSKAKVVYSIYDNGFTKDFSPQFAQKSLLDGINMPDLTSVSKNGSFDAVTRLAIDYSDGVIAGSENINSELLEYAKKSQKLTLTYQDPENYVNSYNDFYDQIMEQ